MSPELNGYISALSGSQRGLPSVPDQTDHHTRGQDENSPSVWEISFRALMESTDPAIEYAGWGGRSQRQAESIGVGALREVRQQGTAETGIQIGLN